MGEQANNPFARNEKLSADEMGKQFARNARYTFGTRLLDGDEAANFVHHAWVNGYCFGNNEVMDKWHEYMAMQPPQPIIMKKDEAGYDILKILLREKIKRDSKGKWWLKLKLWWEFITL